LAAQVAASTRHELCFVRAKMGSHWCVRQRRGGQRIIQFADRARLGPACFAVVLAFLLRSANAAASDRGFGAIPELAEQTPSLLKALLSLPVAAMLGALLAFRPRRRSTPPRTPMVIQTQILLALVGSIVMLVVGSSLARAFGIVGAASLVRYRAKIDDPKDAGVMLASLAVGLASGVGLYLLAAFATVFTLAVLVVVESLGADGYRLFELTLATKTPTTLRAGIEKLLRRRRVEYELRSASDDEVCYLVKLPFGQSTDRLASDLLALDKQRSVSVKWDEKKIKPAGT